MSDQENSPHIDMEGQEHPDGMGDPEDMDPQESPPMHEPEPVGPEDEIPAEAPDKEPPHEEEKHDEHPMEGVQPDESQERIQHEVEGHDEIEKAHYYDSIEPEDFEMPDMFEVEIRLADNQIKIVTVQVEKFTAEKPFIGGYRNKTNGLAYNNAFTQTDQQITEHADMKTKEIQTYQYNTKCTAMMREFGTDAQFYKPGLYFDKRNDKIVYPKPVYTSEQWLED